MRDEYQASTPEDAAAPNEEQIPLLRMNENPDDVRFEILEDDEEIEEFQNGLG